MAVNKSDIINELKKSYPNFLRRDLEKLTSLVLNEIKSALKRGEDVELRNFATIRIKTQKASIRRNPRNSENFEKF